MERINIEIPASKTKEKQLSYQIPYLHFHCNVFGKVTKGMDIYIMETTSIRLDQDKNTYATAATKYNIWTWTRELDRNLIVQTSIDQEL